MLHCTHLNERLEFGMESVAILSRSFITEGDQVLTCRSAIVDLGLNSIDPGLAPDGASCGFDKVLNVEQWARDDVLACQASSPGFSWNQFLR